MILSAHIFFNFRVITRHQEIAILHDVEETGREHCWVRGVITRMTMLRVSVSIHFFREIVMLDHAGAVNQGLTCVLLSFTGSSSALSGTPTIPEIRVESHHFRTLVLERMRLSLHATEDKCEYRSDLHSLGLHRATCPRSSQIRLRAYFGEISSKFFVLSKVLRLKWVKFIKHCVRKIQSEEILKNRDWERDRQSLSVDPKSKNRKHFLRYETAKRRGIPLSQQK